jgi:hypothetical protein
MKKPKSQWKYQQIFEYFAFLEHTQPQILGLSNLKLKKAIRTAFQSWLRLTRQVSDGIFFVHLISLSLIIHFKTKTSTQVFSLFCRWKQLNARIKPGTSKNISESIVKIFVTIKKTTLLKTL